MKIRCKCVEETLRSSYDRNKSEIYKARKEGIEVVIEWQEYNPPRAIFIRRDVVPPNIKFPTQFGEYSISSANYTPDGKEWLVFSGSCRIHSRNVARMLQEVMPQHEVVDVTEWEY